MKEIKLAYDDGRQQKAITCFLPEGWHEVSWAQFTELERLSTDPDLADLDKMMGRLAVLTHLKPAELEQCDYTQLLGLLPLLKFLPELPNPDPERATAVLTLQGRRYYAVPLYTGADWVAYHKIEAAEGLPFGEKAALKMAVFLRAELPAPPQPWYWKLWAAASPPATKPRLEGFDGDEDVMAQRKRLFADNLTVTQVSDLMAFFLKAAVASQMPIQSYGPHLAILLRQSARMERLSGRVMGGNRPTTRFQRILWTMRSYYSSRLSRYLRDSNTIKSSPTASAGATSRTSSTMP